MIKLKRVYEPPAEDDGLRVLVERLWPRGISKERAALGLWLKEIAPSTELRKWYGHDPQKWQKFCEAYWAELRHKADLLTLLKKKTEEGNVTFVYATRDQEHSGALALKIFLEDMPG